MEIFPKGSNLDPVKRVKFGIDPTLDRLHVGHFLALRFVRQMCRDGHKVNFILGTFTARLGDPTGRDTTRPILNENEVSLNADGIERQIRRLMDISPHGQYDITRNDTIFKGMSLGDFMEIASKFTAAEMLSRDAFQRRLAGGGSVALHELLVPLCQGWDSVHLRTQIEVGGSDQLFNFQVARKLQEAYGQTPQSCVLMPILVGTDGRKMSKSFQNCIYLDEKPEQIFGKIMSLSDEVMDEWFEAFDPLADGDWVTEPVESTHPMEKKKILASGIVREVYDLAEARAAKEHFESVIQNKCKPNDVRIVPNTGFLDVVMSMRNSSKSEARRLIKQGSVKVNDVVVTHERSTLYSGYRIQIGKLDHAKVA